MSDTSERIPVIVGVGQVNDRPENPGDGMDPIALMTEALRRADADAGGGVLADCDSLAVVMQIAWAQLNPIDRKVADAIGIDPKRCEQSAGPNGNSPIRLLNDAANMIGAGEANICAVVGGEALRTAAKLAAMKLKEGDRKPNALRDASYRPTIGFAQMHGLVAPVDVYPIYENAIRARQGQSLEEAQTESAKMWSLMSQVAADNEHAWIQEAVAPGQVITPDDQNRPIAFPYTKLQVANSSVNQGAGFLVTSLAEARRRGIAEERLIYVGNGAAGHEASEIIARPTYDHSASLQVSINRTLELNQVTTADVDYAELYSCFPSVPKLSRRVLGWPLDKPITVFGGLTFGGGPVGNYMSHAVASMVDKLRDGGGLGLLHGNGGFGTHNHTILLSSTPLKATFPRNYDFQDEVEALQPPTPPIDEEYAGPATIETYTVHYRRDGSVRMGTVVARTPDGSRTLAIVPASDEPTLSYLTHSDCNPIDSPGEIARSDPDRPGIWTSAA